MILTIRRVTLPFASGINEEHLGVEDPLVVMGEIITVLMIVGVHGPPGKLAIVAAIMQRRCARRGSNDRKICLVLGSVSELVTNDVPLTNMNLPLSAT